MADQAGGVGGGGGGGGWGDETGPHVIVTPVGPRKVIFEALATHLS